MLVDPPLQNALSDNDAVALIRTKLQPDGLGCLPVYNTAYGFQSANGTGILP